jgi:hypothetical protein
MRKLAYGDIIRGPRGDEHMVLTGRPTYQRSFRVVTIKSEEPAFISALGGITIGHPAFAVGRVIDFNERWDYHLIDDD